MEWVFWIFHFSENVPCDKITLVNPIIPAIFTWCLSVCKDGYNSFRRRFCTRAICFDNFLVKRVTVYCQMCYS